MTSGRESQPTSDAGETPGRAGVRRQVVGCMVHVAVFMMLIALCVLTPLSYFREMGVGCDSAWTVITGPKAQEQLKRWHYPANEFPVKTSNSYGIRLEGAYWHIDCRKYSELGELRAKPSKPHWGFGAGKYVPGPLLMPVETKMVSLPGFILTKAVEPNHPAFDGYILHVSAYIPLAMVMAVALILLRRLIRRRGHASPGFEVIQARCEK